MPTTPTDILARLRAANPAPVPPERANEPTAEATLERILNEADSDAGSPSPQRPRPPWRRWLGVAPVLAATLVALVVVGAALVLLGRGHRPAPASRPPGGGVAALIAHTPQRQLRRELGYIVASTQSVQNSRACQLQQPSHATYIGGSPGRDLLKMLGVLRRPPTQADRFNLQGLGPMPDVYRAYIRRAFSAGGVSYYVVPARFDRAAAIPSNRCFDLQSRALNRRLARIPASLRQPTREIQAAFIAFDRNTASHAPRDTICIVSVGGNQTSSSCGFAPTGIKQGFATENSPGPNLDTFSGVVPDGVATVTLIFPAPGRAVTTRVTGNVYAVRVNFYARHGSRPSPSPAVIWRSADGRVLKRVSTSNAATRARICKQQPVACLLLEASSASGSARTSAAKPVVRSAGR